ncbi:KIR protein [Plasmodium coatneyi]|uniref:KIR protein n=1 Tax=Plasmodium coatneyi TaxID=208452 RepID=A0A1B1DU38_9APIC|nr:KIR protein [Plasmodium coatneyi]ANQ06159.1 KIR protein [Plasmodium coatneyi]
MDGSHGSGKLSCSKRKDRLSRYGNILEQRVEEIKNKDNLADDILHACCCLSDIYNESRDKYGPCHLIYYTVGSVLYGKLGNSVSFDQAMEKVQELLGFMLNGGQCKMEHSENGKKLFELMESQSSYNLSPEEMLQEGGNPKEVRCGRYVKYLEGIAKAAQMVKVHCRNEQNIEDCTGIADINNTHSPEYVAQLIDTLISEPQAAGITEKEQQILTEVDLEQLPSKITYNKFENGKGNLGEGDDDMEGTPLCKWETMQTKLKNALQTALSSYVDLQDDIENIAKGWCYLTNMESAKTVDNLAYYAFYYWLGDKIWKERGNSNFISNVIKTIYDTLEEVFPSITYGRICTDVKKENFRLMKEAHEYIQDHDQLQTHLQGAKLHETPCDRGYHEHLENSYKAYEEIFKKCTQGTGGGDACFKQSQGICKDFEHKKLKELKCTLIKEPEASRARNHAPSTKDATSRETNTSTPSPGGSTLVPTIMSTVLPMMGIPAAVAFFLYKSAQLIIQQQKIILPSMIGHQNEEG